MAQNITWPDGTQFQNVPAFDLPKTGGGTARFTDTSPTTATDADVASGKVYFKSDGSQSTGTGSGGSATIQSLSVSQNGTYTAPTGVDGYSPVTVNVSGGASNIVTGTFTGTTTGAAMDVTLNYSGSGYPIAAVIYPEGGINGNSTFKNLIQRYACGMFAVSKSEVATPSTYQKNSDNSYHVLNRYKNSSTSASNYNQASGNVYISTGADTTESSTNVMNFKSATKMSIYIANTSHGCAANIEYRYWVIYSS